MSDPKENPSNFWVHTTWFSVVCVIVVVGLIANGSIIQQSEATAGKYRAVEQERNEAVSKYTSLRNEAQTERSETVRKAIEDYCK